MNKLTNSVRVMIVLLSLSLSACGIMPAAESTAKRPEILTVFPDGSMRLENRLIPADDVVIYEDGFGGEKAAVKVWLEPLRRPFYRDSIIVKRLNNTAVADN